MEETLILKSRF